MSDILNEFGPDTSQSDAGRATSGGQQTPRDVRNYSAPVGPKNINDPKGPGLHGDNCGTCGTQGRR